MSGYPNAPPPYGMHAPPPQVTQIVVPVSFGPDSQNMTCPSCHTIINTRVEHESTTKTHLFALLLCIVCCPFFWLPYCCDTCQATSHYCPKCNAYLGACDR